MALLKTLVIGMGIMIVGAMALLAYGLVAKTGGNEPSVAKTAAPALRLAEIGDIVIPGVENCRIEAVERDPDALTVTLGGSGSCRQVVVIDLSTGTLAARIRLAPPAP